MRACKCTGNDERKRENRETERKKNVQSHISLFLFFYTISAYFSDELSLCLFQCNILSSFLSLSLLFFISLSLFLYFYATLLTEAMLHARAIWP
jgi:hypothetical protein